MREAVLKKLEEKREANEIGSSLEASVVLATGDGDYKKLLVDNKEILRYLFIVSNVEIKDAPAGEPDTAPEIPVAISVDKAKGEKCRRCWNYSELVGSNKDHPALCERCEKAI